MSEDTKPKRPYGWADGVGAGGTINTTADTTMSALKVLDFLAEWMADDLVALRQQRIHSFNPPAAFVDRVVAKMVEDGASVESARADLCDLWPDCRALDDIGRTV
jgi:hypothetical protein